MTFDEIIQQPGQKERLFKDDILRSVHVSVPGEIVSYDASKRTATIQPVIREWNDRENPPLLLDVPVFFMGNFTFTPQKGDGCLVVFADGCIDSWFQNGGVSTPMCARVHSMSDGFAFVGFRQTGGKDLGTIADKAEAAAAAVEQYEVRITNLENNTVKIDMTWGELEAEDETEDETEVEA